MSYDIAVWEGSFPRDDAAAATEFERRYALADRRETPSPAIRGFVDALRRRHPDLTELDDDSVDASPWADGPLLGNASGAFIYLSLVPSSADETVPFIVEAAQAEGLIAFDPQTGTRLSQP